MNAITGEKDLASWWGETRAALNERGVPVARGEVSGRPVPVVGLHPEDASIGVRAILDVLAPRVCLWETEDNEGGDPISYRIGLLCDSGWHVVECGMSLDECDDDEDEDDDEAEAREAEAEAQLTAVLTTSAEALVAEVTVGVGCEASVLEELLITHARKAVGDDEDLRSALASGRWPARHLVRDSLLRDVRDRHVDEICNSAETYARKLREENPGLEAMSPAARRDTVYRAIKKLDRCMTKDSSRIVSDALERILQRKAGGLF